MKSKITLTLFLFYALSNLSCYSDDASIPENEKLSSFTEPFLQFCISEEELLSNLPDPDEVMAQPASLYTFYATENGIKEIRYKVNKNQLDDQYLYNNTNVEFHPNSENFEFMMDWLTAKYGEPNFTQIESYLDTYYFNEPRSEDYDYNVVLNVSNENADSDKLFLAYFKGCEW